LISIVVPTRAEPRRLGRLLDALAAQTYPSGGRELLLALDGAALEPELAHRVEELGGRVIRLERRAGPGAARNAGAAAASGEWLAFTEDDVVPEPDWLERAAQRMEREPRPDVIEGLTLRPGGRALRVRLEDGPQYIPTTLFVRREWFVRVGGYSEDYFDAARGTYFREDADFGFKLEAARAIVVREPLVRVTHPDEHAGPWDPVRWAARYEMDPLLERRHRRLFAERIEVHRLGPFRVRRPIVRACTGIVFTALLAFGFLLARRADAARIALGFTALLYVPVWGKWRFSPLHLPAALLVPWVMLLALLRGSARADRLARSRGSARAAATPETR
jgi:glycosyltransferase involved in cell wall biosynthesis